MSVSRMKNLIILVLSICAACLLAVAIPNRLSQTHEQRRMLAELKTLYESYGLRIELDELPRSPTLYSVELSESGAQTAAQALLGQKAVQPDGGDRFESEYTSELGTLTLTRTGGFSAVLTGGAHVRNYEKSAAKLLHSMGFQFQQLSRRQTEAGVTLEAEQTLLGVPVFGSGLTLSYADGQLQRVEGTFYTGSEAITRVSEQESISGADALARLLAANGRDVTVWSAIPAELKSLSTTHRHPNLPGMELPAAMHYTADIAEACTGRDILLFAVPSPFVRATAKKAAPHIPEGQLIVDVAKGVEDKTLMTMSEIIEDELAKAGRKARVVALSGPTHAEEVARDMPTAIVAASADEDAAKTVQKIFNTPTFRVYTNADRRGTELGGAVKNVIALAVGIALGLGYGDNAKAALITRGNAELSRLGIAMGCKAETFAGLSGMGDLIVTCTSMHSRNLHAGMLIGRGKSVEEAKTEVGQVVEGINALPAACRLARQYKVEMPIVQAVEAILDGKLEARSALMALMGRSLKRE